MPPKRKGAQPAAAAKAAPKQAKKNGQKAVSKELNVPIDEGFHCSSSMFLLESNFIMHAAYLTIRRIEAKGLCRW